MWLHREIRSLADIPRFHARKGPDRLALIDSQGRRSFSQLDAFSNQVANAIRLASVPPRSHIAFIGKNSARYLELLFGVVKAGCAMVPLNWRLAPAELAAIIDDAQCPLVFVDREFDATIEAARALCTQSFGTVGFDSTSSSSAELDGWIAAVDSTDPALAIHPEDTAVMIYTSGTTGRPKGVPLTHRCFDGMRLCEHLDDSIDWREDDITLTVMPTFHLVGSGTAIQALYHGTAVSLAVPTFEPGAFLRALRDTRPTMSALVPTAVQMVLDHPDAKPGDFASLRLMIYAGSSITSTLLRRALVEMKCRFMQVYGATESTGPLTLLRPQQHDLDQESTLRSCGTPLPLVEMRIVDPEGCDVPVGATGELWVRGPNVFNAYWNQPEASRAALHDGWYRTGDAGFRDAQGLYYIVDRVKDMIVTGGENVYSAEVEQALAQHAAVQQSAVVGMPDDKWGERVIAVVILKPGATASAADLIAHCRTRIAGYKVPKDVHFAEVLPATATGKVLKRAVRDSLLEKVSPSSAAQPSSV